MRWLLASALMLAACGSRSGTDHDRVIYVRNDGADLMAWVRGNVDSGVFLIVSHGGPGGEATTYIEDMWPLEEDYALVYWDQRGSGASRGLFRSQRFTYEQFGDDLRAVVDAVQFAYEPNDVFVMGHSFGVEVGTEFLVTGDNQDKVSGWIPVNGTFSVITHAEAQRQYIIDRATEIAENPDNYALDEESLEILDGWRQEAEDAVTPDPMERAFLDTVWERSLAIPQFPYENEDYAYDPKIRTGFASPYSEWLSTLNESRSYYPLDAAYVDWDRREEVANIDVPTAFLWGKWDPIMPPHVAEEYFAKIGTPEDDKRLVWFDYAYHSPMYEDQSPFNEAVAAFIEDYRR